MVEYRYLGNSGLKITEITYGNWVTHGLQVEADRAIKTVHRALDLGITTFDTADVYANRQAEKILGKALKGLPRDTFEVLTKVYWPVGKGGANQSGLSRKHIFDGLHGSLKRLKLDYVDLYQAHRFDYETPMEETFQAFADLVHQGKVMYIGVSEWTAEQIREGHRLATELGIQLVSNQPQYSALWRVVEGKVIPTCQELGMSQIVWSPMAQGVLSGKYLPGQAPPAGSRATDKKGGGDFVKRFLTREILEQVQLLKPIAAQAGLTMPQLAIAWVLQNPNIAAALVGASRPRQLDETVQASGVRLDPEIMDQINTVLAPVSVTDVEETYKVSPKTRP